MSTRRRRSARLAGAPTATVGVDNEEEEEEERHERKTLPARKKRRIGTEKSSTSRSLCPPSSSSFSSKTPSASKRSSANKRALASSTFVSLSSSGTARSLEEHDDDDDAASRAGGVHRRLVARRRRTTDDDDDDETASSVAARGRRRPAHKRRRASRGASPAPVVPAGVTDLDRSYRDDDDDDDDGPSSADRVFLSRYSRDYYRGLFEREQEERRSNDDVRARRRGRPADDAAAADAPRYMAKQIHLGPHMRGILVDWLIEISDEYKLSGATLHLAVRLVDRALDKIVIKSSQLQCLGCACMLVAGKIEEVRSLTTEDFVYVSDRTYDKKTIAEMELEVCVALNFRLIGFVTPHAFLDRFLEACREGDGRRRSRRRRRHPALRSMVGYLAETAALRADLVDTPPSLTAASAVYLARATLGARDDDDRVWTPTLEHYTTYRAADLESTVRRLHEAMTKAHENDLKCVVTKYKRPAFHEVASRPPILEEDLGFD